MSARQEDGRGGEDKGKIKWKLSDVNTRVVSRGLNTLIGEFKMAGDNVISIMKYKNIQT